MKNWKKCQFLLVLLAAFVLLAGTLPGSSRAQAENGAEGSAETAASGEVNEEQLARLLAPIALYPDTLLAQMFMASTYPLEIVEAARYIKENPKLQGDALDEALKNKDWDDSVKALCHFPTVLKQMDEHLDATKQLGDFFLADQKAVMDMVQTLRQKAKEKGELKSTKEQKVEVQGSTIIIQPANPEVIYVPSYNPTVVYGHWWYPSPPYVWYPPPPAFGFVAGVAVGVWASSWCRPHWGRGEIDIDIDRNINVNRPGRPGGGRPRDRMARAQAWKHNPRHRKGVAYRNRDVRKRYGQVDRRARQRDLARGYGGGLDRKARNQIKKQGLKSNGRFGQGIKNPRTRPAGNTHRQARTLGQSGNRTQRQARTLGQSGNRTQRQARTLGQSGSRNQRQARTQSSRNRSTRTRQARTRTSRASRSSSAFRRSGSARSASRSSARGRSSRSFSRRGGGRRR